MEGENATLVTPTFHEVEMEALQRLRTRYQTDADLFSPEEKAKLRFVRWLYTSGRLES